MTRGTALTLAALIGTVTGCAGGLVIHDRPVPLTDRRIELTRAYAAERYGLDLLSITPRVVVLHWTAIPTLEDSYGAFVHETLPGRPELRVAGAVNVGVQFLVDRDGTVYRLQPETWLARHVIGLNHVAVGVENVGGMAGDRQVDDLTGEQIEANVALVRYLVARYPTIEYLIGHHEYRLFEGHPLWRETDPAYRTEKVDPGDRFMAAVRRAVRDLGLKGPGEILNEIPTSR